MEFRTKTEEIKHYYKKLLNDCREHSANELKQYAKSQSPRGGEFTEGMLSGGLNTLVNDTNSNYIIVRRGMYALKDSLDINREVYKNDNTGQDKQSYSDCVKSIIEETLLKLKKTSNINVLEMTDEEIEEYRKVGRVTTESLTNLLEQLNNL